MRAVSSEKIGHAAVIFHNRPSSLGFARRRAAARLPMKYELQRLLLRRRLARAWPPEAAAVYPPRSPAAVLVLAERETPSVAYYFRSRAAAPALGEPPIMVATGDNLVEIPDGCLAVLCRGASPAWLDRLIAARGRLAGVALFLDDDIGRCLDDPGLPHDYALRLARQYVEAAPRLALLVDRIWVSTPALAARLAALGPAVVPPVPLPAPRRLATVFYHGTAAHRLELDFLHEVFAALQARRDDLMIEVIGDLEINRRFRSLPRCRIVHPMGWENFAAHTAASSHAIGLAPLFPSPFNDTRSHAKIFDITRCGAAGIYSNRPPYSGLVRDGIDGILAGDTPEAWVGAIEQLASDAGHRQALADNGVALVERLASHAALPTGRGNEGRATLLGDRTA